MGKSINGNRSCNTGCRSKRLDAIDNFEDIASPDRSLGEFIRSVKARENIIQDSNAITTVVGGGTGETIVNNENNCTTIINLVDIPDPLILDNITATVELRAEDLMRVDNILDIGNGEITIDSLGLTSMKGVTYKSFEGAINIISNETGISGNINLIATLTGTSSINLTADTVNIPSPLIATNINNNVAANKLIISEVPTIPVARSIDLNNAMLQGGVLWYDTVDQEFKPVDNNPTLLQGSPVLTYSNTTDKLTWTLVTGVGDNFAMYVPVDNLISEVFLGNLIPADKDFLIITMWGGGGGGGSISTFPAGGGGGGSGGAIIKYTIPIQGAVSYDVTVGAGGIGGAEATGDPGANGENSIFTMGSITLTAYGGAGGLGSTVIGNYAQGGGGGGIGGTGVGQVGGDASTKFPVKGPVGGTGGDTNSEGIQGDISLRSISGGGGGGASSSADTGGGFGATSGGGTIGGEYLDILAQPIGGTGAGGMGGNGGSVESNNSGLTPELGSGAGGSGGASNATNLITGGDGGSGMVIVEFL